MQNKIEVKVKQDREFVQAKLVGFTLWIQVCFVPVAWDFTSKLFIYI